jgi:hypothetical protein
MTTIRLNHPWRMGDRLARGGFGEVYEARGENGGAAVVKLIPQSPGASRELLFEQLSGVPNIIPILDSGEWRDHYVLVMPRAEKSLRRRLEEAGGKLTLDEAVRVLSDIAEALAHLQKGVVHRDLKPENILLFEGHWCLADFGIARYAEATTAPDTRKFAMTPAYAAPEQWRGERATSATDVYAFGVLAFELLEGRLPFPGPDFREQHLGQKPPAVTGCPPWIASLVNECLFKAGPARPAPTSIVARLRASQGASTSPAAAKLQAAHHSIVEELASKSAIESAKRSEAEKRRELFEVAEQSFKGIVDTLRARVLQAAPATRVSTTLNEVTLHLGNGSLTVTSLQMAPAGCLAAFDYEAPFDVIAYTAIGARKPQDRFRYEGRAHSLWFCDAQSEGLYRWYELAFMISPLTGQRLSIAPFALPPTDKYAGGAFTPVMGVRQIAWQPVAFDQGDEEKFIERWLEWFAAAASGSLNYPTAMPENSGGRHRAPRRRQR